MELYPLIMSPSFRHGQETPWGGCKESGWTKENSVLALGEYTYHHHIWISLSEKPHTFWEKEIQLD